jgi:4a-hydroxytetrahydrobiopterin dehydratase
MAETLAQEAIEERLAGVPGWAVEDGKLHRVLEFADFNEAFGFMTRVAMIAEKMNHHPDWSNSWNKVEIDIVNHAAGGISEACFDLAGRINKLL